MSSASFRLGAFRPWNPSQEKPNYPRNSAEISRYPSPVSMAAVPPPHPTRDNASTALQSHLDINRKHSLPPRPPAEVCFNDKSLSDTQSSQPAAEDSQQTVPLEQHRQTYLNPNPVKIQEGSAISHIDPAILASSSCSSAEHAAEVVASHDITLTDACPSPEPPLVDLDIPPLPSQNDVQTTVTSNENTARVTKCSHTRNTTRNGPRRFNNKNTSCRIRPSFPLVRSQFLDMPFEDRLQFLSWLFEGSLHRCIPTPAGAHTPATANRSSFVDALHDCTQHNVDAEPVNAEYSPSHCVPVLDLHHKLLSCGKDEREAVENEELEYEIEKIIRHKRGARGSIYYLVKWKGFEDVDATWEPYISVKDTTALDVYELQRAIDVNSPHKPASATETNSAREEANSVTSNTRAHANPSSRRGLRWSTEEKRLLKKLKGEQKLPWSEVYRHFTQEFPGRSEATIQLHWYTKAREMSSCV